MHAKVSCKVSLERASGHPRQVQDRPGVQLVPRCPIAQASVCLPMVPLALRGIGAFPVKPEPCTLPRRHATVAAQANAQRVGTFARDTANGLLDCAGHLSIYHANGCPYLRPGPIHHCDDSRPLDFAWLRACGSRSGN